jgi:hypothetical protein
MHSTFARIFSCLVILLLACSPLSGTDRGEYEVKAAFLVNFTHFVEWPASSRGAPFQLCVIGRDPFGDILEKVVGNRTVDNRPIVIKRFSGAADGNSCEIAFVGGVDRETLPKLFRSLEGCPVLTVGDSLKFAERYGMIGFIVDNNRVSLVLNIGRANEHGLKINSQLMRVAKPVSDVSGDGRP